MAERILRRSAAAYIHTTWEAVLGNEVVVVTARKGPSPHSEPFPLPVGSKLTMVVLEPDWHSTKQTAEILHAAHQTTTSHTSKARVYCGLAAYAQPANGMTPESASAANVWYPSLEQVSPVGSTQPLNTRTEYRHMQPSLTAAQGRAFGDLATPLWIDAWQSDTIGIVPDPDWKVWRGGQWVSHPTKVPAYLSFLFYKFADDVAIKSILGTDGGSPHEDATKFTGPIKLKIYVEYVSTPWETWTS